DRPCRKILHVAARVRNRVEKAGGVPLVVLQQRRARRRFVGNRRAADSNGVIGDRRFFFCGVALFGAFGVWRFCVFFFFLREGGYNEAETTQRKKTTQENLAH